MSDEETMLSKLSDATRMLAECRTINDAQQLRDLAEAARHYAKVKGKGIEAVNYATEIRLRAERKLGDMLSQTIHRGRPPLEENGHDPMTFLGHATLATLGVTKNESSFAQTIASLPEPEFEAHLAKTQAAGKELTSAGVYQLARDTEKEAAREAKRVAEYGPLPDEVTLWEGHFVEIGRAIPDESVDLILTDPPYGHAFLAGLDDLGALAARVLKPGGSLLAMYGQMFLLEAMLALQRHLRYQWVFAYRLHGSATVQYARAVHNHWKPILWYVQGTYTGDYQGDVVMSADDPDKRFHDWGQSEEAMASLVKRFTAPGDMILDPLCGGGTNGAVAVALRRRFIGIDADPEAIAISRARLASVE